MVASLVYRTDDGTRWGTGQGSDLAAGTIDLNFWTLFFAVQALEANQRTFAGIDFIVVTGGNQMFVHLQDHRVLGPFVLPTASWTPRGAWLPSTSYSSFDVVSYNGALYLVLLGHTSSAVSFSPFATDGLGHELYALILEEPANALPTGGTIGQRLAKASGSPFVTEWVDDYVRLVSFVAGRPNASELLLQYGVTDHMTFPAGLAGSVAYSNTGTHTPVSYTLTKNGAAIGTIDFGGPSPETVGVTFGSAVVCVPGDVISLIAPTIPDISQADISFSILATLQ